MELDKPGTTGSAASPALHLLLVCAGMAGAGGVALAAVAAHKVESPQLATAAMMLTVHASAVLAIAALAVRMASPKTWAMAGAFMLAAVALFSGDVTLHTLTGAHLFPNAAPIGGSLLIASWLAVALAAVRDWRA